MLPILVPRLIYATTQAKALAMPGGESANVPGWDGIVSVAVGNAWVPDGFSYWELARRRIPPANQEAIFKSA
jgi:hypothetical protein